MRFFSLFFIQQPFFVSFLVKHQIICLLFIQKANTPCWFTQVKNTACVFHLGLGGVGVRFFSLFFKQLAWPLGQFPISRPSDSPENWTPYSKD